MKDKKLVLPNLSLCLPLYIQFTFNCSKLATEQRSGCIRYFQLYHFYSNGSRIPKDILEYANRLNMNDLYEVSKKFEFVNYYLNFNYLCLKYAPKDKKVPKNELVNIIAYNKFKIPTVVFLYEENFNYLFLKFLFIQTCRIFENCLFFDVQIEQYNFHFQRAPYGARCLDYKNLEFDKTYINHIDNEEIGVFLAKFRSN